MKVKVQCTCGTRFEFEVEPVNERMPVAINCPSCNADATELANEVIKQQLAAAKSAITPAPAIPTAAPAPANPSIPALRIPGVSTQPSQPSPPTAPVASVIPSQPAMPAPSRPAPAAPAPVAAAPAAPTPPAPSQGGLRISKPAASHT